MLIAIAAYYFSGDSSSDEDEIVEKRNVEEKRLLNELEALETKKAIASKHEFINSFTDDYLKKTAEKRYRQLIQCLVIESCLI